MEQKQYKLVVETTKKDNKYHHNIERSGDIDDEIKHHFDMESERLPIFHELSLEGKAIGSKMTTVITEEGYQTTSD